MMKFLNSFKIIYCFSICLLSTSVLSSENLENRIKELTLELRCMTCQNQSVYDSDSDYSKDIKIFVKEKFEEGLNEMEIKKIVKEKFEAGMNEKEIKDFLTKRYGEYILFKPYFNSKNVFLWLFPFILLIISILILLKKTKKIRSK